MAYRLAVVRLFLAAALLTPASVLAQLPVLEADKTVLDNDGPPLERGDLVIATITVANVGAAPATGVIVHDPLPAGLESIAVVSIPPGATDESDLTGPAPFVRVTGFDVPAGGTAGIVFSAFVAPSAPGPDVCNQAEVTSVEIATPVPTDDPSTATPGDPTCLVLDGGVVRFAVTKSMVDPNGPPASPGETLLFTIDIDNTGTAPATAVVLRDPLPAAFDAVNVVLIPPGATDRSVLTGPAREVRIEDFAIPAGGRATTVFSATLSPTATATVCNQAFASSLEVSVPVASDDPRTPFSGDPTCASLPGAPVLQLAKTARDLDGGPLADGDRVLYAVEVRNPGTAPLTAVSVTDPLPRGLRNAAVLRLPPGAVDRSTFGGPSPLFAADGFGVEPGGTALLVYSAEVAPSAPGELCNQASATSLEVPGPVFSDDPRTLEPADPTCLLTGASPDLRRSTQAALDGNGAPWTAGDTVAFTIEVRNAGSGAATGVVVEEPLPAGLVNAVVTGLPPGATDESDLAGPAPFLKVTGFAVAAGATATITWTAAVGAVADGTRICAGARVASAERAATFPSDDPATLAPLDPTCLVVGPALFDSTKTLIDVDRAALEPGDLVFWAVDARNSGSGDATGVRVSDDLPPGLVNLAVVSIPPGATDSSDLLAVPPHIEVSGFSVAAGAVERVLVAGEVELVPPGPELCNDARLSADTLPGPIPSDDESTLAPGDPTCVELGRLPDLAVTKEVVSISGSVPALPGDLLLYLVRIRNGGNGAARVVRITDVLTDLEAPEWVSLPPGARDLTDPLLVPATLVVELPRIDPGAQAFLAFLARIVASPLAAEVCNRATVSARELVSPAASDDPLTTPAGDRTCLAVDTTAGVPAVTSILPCRGTKKGGTEVTITGTGFQPGVEVTFDGLLATVVSVSPTEIVVLTPLHPPVGPVDVVVMNPDATRVTVSGGYVYTPAPFPIALGGKNSGSDAYLIWTGGTGPYVVLRSNDPDFACGATDAFVASFSTLTAPPRGKNRRVTFFRVE